MKTKLINVFGIAMAILLLLNTDFTSAQTPTFWGMTAEGGAFNAGTIFKMEPDGTGHTIQHSFAIETPGSRPGFGSQMLQLANGKMYGVTEYGGLNASGVLYEYNPATNTYIKLYDFAQATGRNPTGGLALAPNGKLYGMTQAGGSANFGVLFEFDLTTNTYTKKVDFIGANGSFPFACTLYLHTNGKFYGVTNQGGTSGLGLLFEYDPATNTYTKKIDFTGTANGSYPYTTLMITSTGRVFGATSQGGTNNNGTLYEYNPSTNVLTKRRDFSSADGRFPLAPLVEADNGRLYGLAGSGGTNGQGTLFEFNLSTNTFTKKIDFAGTNGNTPYPGFVKAANGKLYGMTNGGGVSNVGVVFEYDVASNTLTKKLDFFLDPATGKGLNGMVPTSNFTLSSTGLLYGTTSQGGSTGAGVIFEYNTSTNSYSKKIDFFYSPNGSYSFGGLAQAANGKLYGMTQIGGVNDEGALFEFNPNGNVYTKLYDFNSTSGNYPTGSLAAAPDGKLYGMTPNAGSFDQGTLFEFDPATNTFTKKVDFDLNSNGSEPQGSLLLASNNKFYGVTSSGGQTGYGVLFEYDPATSTLINKIEFDYNTGSEPYGDLIQTTNGKLYGMTREGGDNGNASGTLFEYDIATNTMTPHVNFSQLNGENPEGNLVQAPNGKLYGMARYGGVNGNGVLFEFDLTTNTYSKKIDFGGAAFGSEPSGSLALSPNGKLYGGTNYGGANGRGVIFEYDPTNNTFTKKLDLNSTSGAHILWQRFLFVKGEQTITFNSLPNKLVNDAAFTLSATSSVALPVSYTSSNTAVATVSGNTVTIVGAGVTTITASQPGDASYHAATSVSQTLTVNKIDQNITFAAITDKTVGDPAFALTASTTSSLPVSFSTVSNKITINGAQVSIVSAGRVTVTATQTGNANYNAATPVERSFCIKPAQPTITLSNLNSEAPTLTSSASTGNQWYRNDVVITGATNTVFTATEEGMYKVRSVVDDCVSDFSDEVILVVTSLEENGNQISLFPNPTEDWLTVSLNELNGNKQISIVNTQGNVKESKEVEGSEATFNVAAYARGVYFVKVKMKNSVRVLRFVKQ